MRRNECSARPIICLHGHVVENPILKTVEISLATHCIPDPTLNQELSRPHSTAPNIQTQTPMLTAVIQLRRVSAWQPVLNSERPLMQLICTNSWLCTASHHEVRAMRTMPCIWMLAWPAASW